MTEVSLSLLGAEECARLLSMVSSALFFYSFYGQFRNVAGVEIMAAKGGNFLPFLVKVHLCPSTVTVLYRGMTP